MNISIITWMVFLPLAGGLLLAVAGEEDEAGRRRVRVISIAVSLITFVLSLGLYYGFRADYAGMQFVERLDWIPRFGIAYKVGIDGI
ncbi:MAG: NADH-quinone oxidoreductase subunit M, partial [Nitrospinota bacterium]|nr:NADH-quinone oxidoreductase subunit M [Nitrospinota bacterium]